MTDIRLVRLFENSYPNTNEPFQRLVMAASKFGKDKNKAAMDNFVDVLAEVRGGLVSDGYLTIHQTNIVEVMNAIMVAKALFQSAYPNWNDAYEVIEWFDGRARVD